MKLKTTGIHHITAIAGSPQQNLDFYTRFLALRLVKRTVNFDDPFIFHFYYGDKLGTPGTILTFFPRTNALKGKSGAAQVITVIFAIPVGSVNFWIDRFTKEKMHFSVSEKQHGIRAISFKDPDGISLELIEHPRAKSIPGFERDLLPADHSIRGFRGVRLALTDIEPSAMLLVDYLGFRCTKSDKSAGLYEYQVEGETLGTVIKIKKTCKDMGRTGRGSIHHVAFRAANYEELYRWRRKMAEAGLKVTPVVDRKYFHSIYFREPGGILYEIATDPPGFTIDETPEELGNDLKLPTWLEPERQSILARLPKIKFTNEL